MKIISRRWVRISAQRNPSLLNQLSSGVNFMEKTITVRRTTITFSIWDLGGQREFVNMLPLVCNDAVAILFMFDLSRKSTLNSVKEWYRQARGFNKVSQCCLPVFGCAKLHAIGVRERVSGSAVINLDLMMSKRGLVPLKLTSSFRRPQFHS